MACLTNNYDYIFSHIREIQWDSRLRTIKRTCHSLPLFIDLFFGQTFLRFLCFIFRNMNLF